MEAIMKNNIGERFLLSSYEENGLILDEDKSEALSFLTFCSNFDITEYISRYAVLSSTGKLIFVPGTTFSSIKRDILFDTELGNLVISSGALLLVEIERKVSIFKDQSYLSLPGHMTLEDIWFEYNTSYSSSLRQKIASSFGLDEYTFSDELEMISYAYERARERRKLIDHIFLDGPSITFPSLKSNMIAASIYMTEGLLNYITHPLKNQTFKSLIELIERYSIDGKRTGLTYLE